MRITELRATYGRTFNLDDYESMRIDVTMAAELDEEDFSDMAEGDVQEVFGKLFAALKASVKQQAMPVLSRRDAKRKKLSGEATEAYAQ